MTEHITANHSLEVRLRNFGGARARRVIDAPDVSVREHAHDWPVLSIYVAGSLENRTEDGDRAIHSPWVVLYGAGAPHANRVGREGFEQVEIEFDPAWLRLPLEVGTAVHWRGGQTCHAARQLSRLWLDGQVNERQLADATRTFLAKARSIERWPPPRWLDGAIARVRAEPGIGANALASELALSPHWLAQAYRCAAAEGIRETARRVRVERAATLLRATDRSAADIAAAAGFCDQSHMIRSFHEVLGLTPGEVRGQWRRQAARTITPRRRCAASGSTSGVRLDREHR